jgi:hypothetical protein
MNQTIYWANLSNLPDEDMQLKPLLADLANSQSNYPGMNHVACPATSSKHRNTFMSTIPYDMSARFVNNKLVTDDSLIKRRLSLYDDSNAFDWKINRIFFSATPQIMEVSPAFLHRTSYSQQGHAPSGAFDVGQWFRPASATFQLWSGQSEFKGIKGEAHLYFNFPSDNKVVLEQFHMTDKLVEVMDKCMNYKYADPKRRLPFLYDIFSSAGGREEVIKEISQNLYNKPL